MASPISAKLSISGISASISSTCMPSNWPAMKVFCRPVKSGWKPMPSSSSAATRPCKWMSPQVGWVVPVIIFNSVLLPAPLTPTMPTASPG
ncbi:hypothetical protein D9M69_507040 [compost metagenome]